MKSEISILRRMRQNTLTRNSVHLYFDMLWFGVLTGSTLSFLAIYAARIGASSFQIGMINGAQAVVNLMVALPAGHLLAKYQFERPVFFSAIFQRIFYSVLIFIPLLFAPSGQMTTILVITFVMSIPGTVLAIGFNALFADSVPAEHRGRVAGIRNAVLSIATIISTLACGQVLTWVAFPLNYQIVFGIGFLGAAMSTLHLWFVKPVFRENHAEELFPTIVGKGGLLKGLLRFDVLRERYGRKIGLLFAFHFAQYLGIAIFPIYQVNVIHISDSVISIGNGLFYVLMFFVSIRLEGLTRKFGYKNILGIGVIILALYPAFLSLSTGPLLFYVACIFGGIAWGLAGGAIYNYVLESAPQGGRSGFLAWYNLVFNAGILAGSLCGPLLGELTNLNFALWVVTGGRLAAGLALLYWG
ncbi:MAG TPA: MFS transporter [Leptolinea sp.]